MMCFERLDLLAQRLVNRWAAEYLTGTKGPGRLFAQTREDRPAAKWKGKSRRTP